MTLPPPYEIDSHAVASKLREAMTKTEAVSDDSWEKEVLALMVKHLDPKTVEALTFEHGPYQITKVSNKVMTFASAIALSRRAANSAGGVEDDEEDLASDDRWNAGVNYAIERLCEILGVDPKAISWDAATETVNGDVMSVICNVMVAAYGEEWSSNERDTARIRSALSSPAVEAEPVALTDEKVTLHRFRPTGAENWSEWRVGPVRFSDRVLSGMEAQQSDFYTHPSSPVSAEVTVDLIEVCKKLLDYRDARYVPNMLFVRLEAALAALNGGRENG